MKEPWPHPDEALKDQDAVRNLQIIIDVITAIRQLRAEHAVEQSAQVRAVLVSNDHRDLLKDQQEHIIRLGKLSSMELAKKAPSGKMASAFIAGVEVHLPLAGLVDGAKAKDGLLKEQENLRKYVAALQGKLKNAQFIAKAPPDLVKAEKQKLLESEEKLKKIGESLKQIG